MTRAPLYAAILLSVLACKSKERTTSDTATGALGHPAATPSTGTSDTMGGVAPGGRTDTGAMGTTGTGTMRDTGMAGHRDTGMAGQRGMTGADTGTRSRMRGATGGGAATPPGSAQNQTQSGVTNAKTGQSTLGKGVKKVSPTEGAAVTSKGDTIRQGGDTVKGRQPPR
ncbi:MAG TPA: hypothetical protein VFS05_13815 [Gemmatimonadaceae bacterium]|nr:hypothetical protein [Gemmatimonadaceae bacterium]